MEVKIDLNVLKPEFEKVLTSSLSESLGFKAIPLPETDYISFPMYGGYSFKGDYKGEFYVSSSIKCGFKIMRSMLNIDESFPAKLSAEQRLMILESERELANILTGKISEFFYNKGVDIENSRPLTLNYKNNTEEYKNRFLYHFDIEGDIIQVLIIFR